MECSSKAPRGCAQKRPGITWLTHESDAQLAHTRQRCGVRPVFISGSNCCVSCSTPSWIDSCGIDPTGNAGGAAGVLTTKFGG
eukprot:1161557-Pelagomonas_calceolata.AAC.3